MAEGFFEFREQMTARRSSVNAESTGSPGSKASDRTPLTVSQLTARIERAIQSQIPESLLVQGEVSNFNRNRASGHLYFTMKDQESCIDCVMWKSDSARMKFMPKDGMELLASGRLQVYGKRGKYQLYISTLRPVGQGALELAFRQLRAKLEAEGLFAAERKRPIPAYPMTMAIVTSREGAALADMLKVLRRFSWLRLLLWPVPVQGEGAAAKIAAAISQLSRCSQSIGAPDLIILGRGGGSLEDLWQFNEEIVARAIASSQIPIVTGIGHEVDVSIADLAADYHAHTPTEAAQVVTANWRNASEAIDVSGVQLRRALRATLQNSRQRLRAVERHEAFRRPFDRINLIRQFLDDRQRALVYAMNGRTRQSMRRLDDIAKNLEGRLPAILRRRREEINDIDLRLRRAAVRRMHRELDRFTVAAASLSQRHPRYSVALYTQRVANISERLWRGGADSVRVARARVDSIEARLRALSPSAVLQRGYSITLLKRDGLVIRSAAQVRPGDRLLTRLSEGEIQSIVHDSAQIPLFE